MRTAIDACIKHNAKLVFFDNVYLYNISTLPHMTEGFPINPPSKKVLVWKEVDDMTWQALQSGKLTALIARSADFYGPTNEKSFLIKVVCKNLMKEKKSNWFINADKKYSFTFTPDAAKAIAILGNTADAYNQTWHLPTDSNAITGREISALLSKEMQIEKSVSILPMWLLKILGLFMPLMREMPEMMYQYDRDYFFDSSKFEKRFGFKPTSYQKGVKQTVE